MSRTIPITAAIDEIATTFTRLEAEGTHASRAYFFMVGAGISTPQVKLAGAIEDECRAAAPDGVAIPADAARSPMRRYSFWLERAHPNRIQRQRYFRLMIENRAISAANFRLAHAIMSGHAPRLVVTTNFDDFLTRALTLFGARPIVSDHPESAIRIDPESDDIQILHVHGTHWFYDCCNLDGEISVRAQMGAPHQNVSWRLGQILDRRSPLVLGYSGWEGDVFMTSLKARLDAPSGLPYNLYWFCYRRDAIDTLPRWLVDHADVSLVVPEGPPAAAGSAAHSRTAEDRGADDAAATEQLEPVDGRTSQPRLEAVTVLDRLNPALGLDEPELTRNPIGFFADHLRASLLVADADDVGEGDDPYRLRWTIEQLDEMRSQWPSSSEDALADDHDAETLLAQVQSAVRRSRHREAIATARAIAMEELTTSQLAELRETVMLAAIGLFDDSEDELAGYDLVVAAGNLSGDEADVDEIAMALLYRGITLERLERHEEAVATFDEMIGRYGEETDNSLREAVATAMRRKGYALTKLDRSDEALAALDLMIERFQDDDDPDLRRQVATALSSKAYRLSDLDRGEEAVAVYQQLIDRYRDDTNPEVHKVLATAMVSLGYTLGKLERDEEELEVYARLVERFESDPNPEIQRQVATALRHRGYTLGQLDRGEEALASFDELIERYGDSVDPKIKLQVATAMVNKGFRLGALERSAEEIATYDALVAQYKADPSAQVRAQVAKAMYNKAYRLNELDQPDDAVATFGALIGEFADETDSEIAGVVARARAERERLAG